MSFCSVTELDGANPDQTLACNSLGHSNSRARVRLIGRESTNRGYALGLHDKLLDGTSSKA